MAATGSISASARQGDGSRDDTGPADDWVVQAADTVEKVVTSVRSKTTEPLERIARVVVYGIVAAFLGVAAAVLFAVGLVRVLDIAIPADVWAAHAVVGGIFTLAGLFLWGKRTAKQK